MANKHLKSYRKGQWLPGESAYSVFIKNLKENDPEGYLQHCAERKARKSIKEKEKVLVNAHSTALLTVLFNKAMELLENGGAQEFAVVYDRLVGKPDSKVDVTSNGQTMAQPNIIFRTEELEEWSDEFEASKNRNNE